MLSLRLTVPGPPVLVRVMLNLPSIPGLTQRSVGVEVIEKFVGWARTAGNAARNNTIAIEHADTEIMDLLFTKRLASIKCLLSRTVGLFDLSLASYSYQIKYK